MCVGVILEDVCRMYHVNICTVYILFPIIVLKQCESGGVSCSAMSDSLKPYEL